MTLLAPWALWFSLIGAAVVALYLLKIKRRQASVPALDFWLRLAGRTRVHSLLERLKRLLSLLLWLAVVACLVLALGNPLLSLGRIKPRAIAVVLDNSASMQTLELQTGAEAGSGTGGSTRLAQAQRALAELTTRRPVTDEWLLIDAGHEPRVLQPWTFDTRAVRRSGGALTPFLGAGDLAGAVELAGQLLAGKPDPCIVVISDGAAGAVEQLAKDDPRIIPWPVGHATDNLGIGRLAVRAHRQHSNYHVLISVVNASDRKVDTQIVLEIDGSTHSVELVSVEPHAVWEKTVILETPESGAGGVLRASIDRADALALDNEAFAILPPIRPAVVWLVTPRESAFFFEQALASMEPLVWAEESLTLTPEQYSAALAALDAPPGPDKPALKRPDLTIFNGFAPPALPPAGRFVLVNAWPKEIPATINGTLEAPHLFLAPRPHALIEHVTLQGARLARAQRVVLREPATVLAHSADGDPLIILVDQPDRQALCLAFDVLDSDLPFRNAFPLLLRNAVASMHHEAPAWLRSEYRLGEPVRALRPLPAGVSSVEMGVQRDGKTQALTLPVADAQFTFSDTARAGAIRLTVGADTCYAALNIGAPDESRIEPFFPEEAAAQRLALSRRLLGAMPWIGLVAIAALVVVLEWLTYHFRWTE